MALGVPILKHFRVLKVLSAALHNTESTFDISNIDISKNSLKSKRIIGHTLYFYLLFSFCTHLKVVIITNLEQKQKSA